MTAAKQDTDNDAEISMQICALGSQHVNKIVPSQDGPKRSKSFQDRGVGRATLTQQRLRLELVGPEATEKC